MVTIKMTSTKMAGCCSVGQIINNKTLSNSWSKLPSTVKKRIFCTLSLSCSFDFEKEGRSRRTPTFGTVLNRNFYKQGIHNLSSWSSERRVRDTKSRYFFQVPGQLKSNKRKEYSNRKLIGFSMENLYHVVSHVEDYKHFVPWCRDSTVFDQRSGHMKCKLVVGYPPLVERYISVLTLVPPNLVVSECTQGELFNYMKTVWRFSPGLKGNPKTSIVDLHVAFEFRSVLHSHLSSVFFDEVVKKMVSSFEKRCEYLFGRSSLTGSRQKQRKRTRTNTTMAPHR